MVAKEGRKTDLWMLKAYVEGERGAGRMRRLKQGGITKGNGWSSRHGTGNSVYVCDTHTI